ncbi:hypothetical protein [Ligilactobacillus pobuzihii]|uniref:DUF536 domain-containing protein n=1 Tax=Ligilactobacillus pobuzihii TaxID=449659 RepID=A0A0R2LMQ6_9LACO|nr:hypothetical protein [Ligilactobacillus pobuzihii]KRK08997.1 hypothetical protein FD11_GL001592 [Ligilactobacillus pobuzihii E100301 = KCTC 13174]KRO01243.1 hypothetical protein IV66_GL000618 [Ligilactobacillus pobuzihii]GEN49288.1 hypothetical protein LPO01_20800 [Ligilactobacillus pobuzihii]
MTKTVKILAEELNVTPQYIQKIIKSLPETNKPTLEKHKYIIDKKAEKLIIKEVTGPKKQQTNQHKTNQKDELVSSLKDQISYLKQQIDMKDNQINELQKQNFQSQKLIDQEQQLHLSDQKRIEKLEQPVEEKEENATVQNSATDNQQEKQPKKGFLKRLFSSN